MNGFSGFPVPPLQPVGPDHHKAFIDQLVKQSVQGFTRELGNFVMIARSNGWIEKYEAEVRRVAEAAWKEARG